LAAPDFRERWRSSPKAGFLRAICAEFLGGLGLIVGFLSRIAAFGILCVMLVAIFRVHLPNGFFMNWAGNQKGEGFEFHILAIGIALAILIRGAGAFSIDGAMTKSRR
jgi:putative oxidoreductase